MKNNSNSWIILAGVMLLLIIGVSLFSDGQDAAAYEAGHTALTEQDCATARAEFEKVLSVPRIIDVRSFAFMSRQEKAQCDLYDEGVAQEMAGQFGDAAANYYALLRDYPESPLYSLAKERVSAIIETYAANSLVNEKFCAEFTGAVTSAVIAEDIFYGNYPSVVDTCGRMYEGLGEWKKAITLYEIFLQGTAAPDWTEYFRGAMARAMLTDASSRSPGQLPVPFYLGPWSPAKIVVNFFNDSPDAMRVTVNGPVTRIFEIEGCLTCQTYSEPPAACPKQGRAVSYEMPEGVYNVIIETGAGKSAKPYVGAWSLGSGQYDSCFTKIE